MSRPPVVPLLALTLHLTACTQGPEVQISRPVVPMPDGVKLATDVILPKGATKVPVILIQTRYWRSFGLKVPDPPGALPPMPREDLAGPLIQAGYGVMLADVRGTGASEGSWPRPWSPAEVRDMASLIDWIAHQSWSDGRVGTTGTSYEGTTALLAATSHHPALRAVLAREIEWDLVDELLAPGGVRNLSFPEAWTRSTQALDRNEYPELFPESARWIVQGVHRTGEDPDGKQLAALVAKRQLVDVGAQVAQVRAGTDSFGVNGPPAREVGPTGHGERLRATRAAVAVYGSWWDGATAEGVLRAAAHMPVAEAVIGPWLHEGDRSASPWRGKTGGTVELGEIVAFFDRHLKGEASATAPSRRWYVAGAESWATGSAWPSTHLIPWYLGAAGAMSATPPGAGPGRRLEVDFQASTGTDNRWMAGMLHPVAYGDRRAPRGQLSWASAPATRPMRLFGAPRWSGEVQLSGTEAALHVYLEVVEPDGQVRYLTEGVTRTRGGRVTLPLRSVAFELRPGQALRCGVTGADQPTFERVPATGALTMTFTGVPILELPVER